MAFFDTDAIVSGPTETPNVGTSARDLNSGKVFMLSRRVSSAKVVTRVVAIRDVPRPLKATWPSLAPDASKKQSTPKARN